MNKRAIWIASIAIVVVVSVTAITQWESIIPSAQALSQEAAKGKVLNQYPGTIVEARLTGDKYYFELELITGLYAVQMSADKGQILSIKQLEAYPMEGNPIDDPAIGEEVADLPDTPAPQEQSKAGTPKSPMQTEQPPASNVKPNPAPSSAPKPNPSGQDSIDKPIRQDQPTPAKPAPVILTKDEASNIAAESIGGSVSGLELKQTSNQSYYLVRVELEDDDDDTAIVQVHALTGAVLSVTWDDTDDDDDDDNDSSDDDDDDNDDDTDDDD